MLINLDTLQDSPTKWGEQDEENFEDLVQGLREIGNDISNSSPSNKNSIQKSRLGPIPHRISEDYKEEEVDEVPDFENITNIDGDFDIPDTRSRQTTVESLLKLQRSRSISPTKLNTVIH